MAVLDSLVLEFSLDPSKFERGRQQIDSDVKKLKDETQRAATDTEASTHKLTEAFTGLKREFLGFLGIAVGGAAARQFFDFLVNLDASTSRLSRTLGVNIAELNAWQSAAKQFGGTGQEVAGTIMRLGQEVWNFKFGAGSNLPGQLNQLGIDAFDSARDPKSGIQILRDMADWVDRSQMPMAGKAAFLRGPVGLNETVINMIIRGRAELEKTLTTYRQNEEELKKSAAAAEAYQAATSRLDASLTNLARTFAPVINAFATMVDYATKLVQLWGKLGFLPSTIERGAGGTAPTDDRARLVATGLARLGGGSSSGGGGGDRAAWANILAGISFLESNQTGKPDPNSSAAGYFHFIRSTAAMARAAGIADPRFGNYANQSTSAEKFIRRFHPEAAARIDQGDVKGAIPYLYSEFPSLPGSGSQQQNRARYATFDQILAGGGPRPPGGGQAVTVQNMNVYSRADDAAGISRDIKGNLERNQFTAQVPQGTQ